MHAVNDSNFEDIAIRLFRFQAENNPVYKQYLQNLKVKPDQIEHLTQVPFLPISFFKTQTIRTGQWIPETEFKSSGTTGSQTSRHSVANLAFYQQHAVKTFEQFYGSLKQYHILALLPAYLERAGSSLIAMIDQFIRASESDHSGYYLYNHEALLQKINALNLGPRKILLWGVSFALLDLAENFEIDLSRALVMETGGMKGRRQEITRQELHAFLNQKFNTKVIHSEYGMTELMSQAYSQGFGYYRCPPWMKVIIREINDPFTYLSGKVGGINVVDLANFSTCAFIETQDLGKLIEKEQFEILGRIDNSDVRGCNLLVE
ncbi:MAG: acyl-CoA synthetase [Bacteroidetes bacterium OLB12]|nr:MAG: acyl-CoA synthetase [Bacteroidetes bacterium OLB12]HNR72709.1 acyl transferase [Cyclobacteriaceae bacterium]HNU40899.1 acyl transferase [Cyclobacteriaceae bacterium]